MKHSRLGDTGYWIEQVTGITNDVSMARCAGKGGHMFMFKQEGSFPHVYKFLREHGRENLVLILFLSSSSLRTTDLYPWAGEDRDYNYLPASIERCQQRGHGGRPTSSEHCRPLRELNLRGQGRLGGRNTLCLAVVDGRTDQPAVDDSRRAVLARRAGSRPSLHSCFEILLWERPCDRL